MSWPLVRLGDVAPPKASKHSFAKDDEVWTLNLDQVEADTGKVLQKIMAPASEAGSSTHGFSVQHVLYSKLRPYLNKVVLPDEQGLATTELVPMLPDPLRLDRKYLAYYLRSKKFVDWVSSQVAGAKMPRVSMQLFWQHEIPLPILSEQVRIAAVLDKADAIRRKRQQAIQLADDFLRTVFLNMFGDPLTNPKEWEVKKVSECLAEGIILQIQDGNHGNDHPKVSDFVEEGIPFVTANVVRRGQVLFDNCYYLGREWLNKLRVGFAKPRDVLLSHKGSLGFTAVLDSSFDNYIFSPQTTYYRVDESRLAPEYLKAYFDSTFFQRLFEKEGVQSTRAYVGITRQKELPIMLPGIQVQREFLAILAQFESMIEKLVSSSNEIPDCLDSLSQKAFCGEL
ncbi:Type-1 restriction enzyme EcoKI specificity protein [compost metagenome]